MMAVNIVTKHMLSHCDDSYRAGSYPQDRQLLYYEKQFRHLSLLRPGKDLSMLLPRPSRDLQCRLVFVEPMAESASVGI